MGVSDFLFCVRRISTIIYRKKLRILWGIKTGKNGNIKRKRKHVRTYERGVLFMRAKTEKLRCLFYARETKEGCIMQKYVYTLV